MSINKFGTTSRYNSSPSGTKLHGIDVVGVVDKRVGNSCIQSGTKLHGVAVGVVAAGGATLVGLAVDRGVADENVMGTDARHAALVVVVVATCVAAVGVAVAAVVVGVNVVAQRRCRSWRS